MKKIIKLIQLCLIINLVIALIPSVLSLSYGWEVAGRTLNVAADVSDDETWMFQTRWPHETFTGRCNIFACEEDNFPGFDDDWMSFPVDVGEIIRHLGSGELNDVVGATCGDDTSCDVLNENWNDGHSDHCTGSCSGVSWNCEDNMGTGGAWRPSGDMLCEPAFSGSSDAYWIICRSDMDWGSDTPLFVAADHTAYTCNSDGTWTGPYEICNDFFDNDRNDEIDCADFNCHGETGSMGQTCEYWGETMCEDGADNDGNSLVDCYDPACSGTDYCLSGVQFQRFLPKRTYEWTDDDGEGDIDSDEWYLTVKNYTYDGHGRVITEVDAKGNVFNKRYNDMGFVDKLWNEEFGSENDPSREDVYSEGGLSIVSKDFNDHYTTTNYDGFGRVKKIIKSGDSSTSPTREYFYSDYQSSTQPKKVVTSIKVDADRRNELIMFYDGYDNLIQTQIQKSDSTYIVQNRKYDSQGRLWKKFANVERVTNGEFVSDGEVITQTEEINVPTNMCGLGDSGLKCDEFSAERYCLALGFDDYLVNSKTCTPEHVEYIYGSWASQGLYGGCSDAGVSSWVLTMDCVNYITESAFGDVYSEYVYYNDPLGRLKEIVHSVDGSKIEYSYGASSDGFPTLIVEDEEDHQTKYTFDLLGNLLRTEQGESFGIDFNYEYDAHGNIVKIIDPYGREITSTYDELGRIISSYSLDSGNMFYDYDLLGNIVNQENDYGEEIAINYDQINRIAAKYLVE